MECVKEKDGKKREKNKEISSGQHISYSILYTIVKTFYFLFFFLSNKIQSLILLREYVFLLAKELKTY